MCGLGSCVDSCLNPRLGLGRGIEWRCWGTFVGREALKIEHRWLGFLVQKESAPWGQGKTGGWGLSRLREEGMVERKERGSLESTE